MVSEGMGLACFDCTGMLYVGRHRPERLVPSSRAEGLIAPVPVEMLPVQGPSRRADCLRVLCQNGIPGPMTTIGVVLLVALATRRWLPGRAWFLGQSGAGGTRVGIRTRS